MLRVTIELIPVGNEAMKKTLGVMHIANVGGDVQVANYEVVEMSNSGQEGYSVNGVIRHQNIFAFLRGLFRHKRGGK